MARITDIAHSENSPQLSSRSFSVRKPPLNFEVSPESDFVTMADIGGHNEPTISVSGQSTTGDISPSTTVPDPSADVVRIAGVHQVKTDLKGPAPSDVDSLAEEELHTVAKRSKYKLPIAPRETSVIRINKRGYIDIQKKEILARKTRKAVVDLIQSGEGDVARPTKARKSNGYPNLLVGNDRRLPKRDKAFQKAMEKPKLPIWNSTLEQRELVDKSANFAPFYLGRTASQITGNRFDRRPSSGHTTSEIIMPHASTHRGYGVHSSIHDIPQLAQSYMIGRHLLWQNIKEDEYMSYSKSGLFLIVHALNRRHNGQGNVTIQFLDRRVAKVEEGQAAAAFYPALDLYAAFRVPENDSWTTPNQGALKPRKFTQEFLSHGVVVLGRSRFKRAPIEDLIRDGLFEIVPELDVPDEYQRVRYYLGTLFPCRLRHC